MPTSKRSEADIPTVTQPLFFAPALIWVFFIFYFSLMPGDEVPDVLADMNDKLLHGMIYFVSAALIYLGFIRYNLSNNITGHSLMMIIVVCTLAGTVVELIQHFWVENRNGDWQDFMANTLGSLACVLLFRLVHGMRA